MCGAVGAKEASTCIEMFDIVTECHQGATRPVPVPVPAPVPVPVPVPGDCARCDGSRSIAHRLAWGPGRGAWGGVSSEQMSVLLLVVAELFVELVGDLHVEHLDLA